MPASEHHRCATRLGEQSPEGVQLNHFKRVNHRECVGCSNLNQTELTPVGVLRNKLSIESQMRMTCQLQNKLLELRVRGDSFKGVGCFL